MSRKASKRVSFSPDISDKLKHGGSHTGRRRKRVIVAIFSFSLPRTSRFSPQTLLRRLGAKMVRALRFVSINRSSRKVSSSNLARSRSLAESIDSHRAEAIEDCIEFLNSSSSSLSRSNSVSTCSC
ncbi:josephin-like protein [Carica papaya]|uniref:josephin-like protein n=1 Tax=Carica papaya TaxID=3649 RepID=UPI000B8CEF5C|nr:josephin-like protein [Carica papaya]